MMKRGGEGAEREAPAQRGYATRASCIPLNAHDERGRGSRHNPCGGLLRRSRSPLPTLKRGRFF